jgi:hypothetical protein
MENQDVTAQQGPKWNRDLNIENDVNGTCVLTASQKTQAEDPCDNGARPRNVPVDAIWVGSLDGGAYILLTRMKSRTEERYCAEVFNDITGKVLYSGLVIRDPPVSRPIEAISCGIFVGWDGSEILLNDGTVLRATGTQCVPLSP